MAKNLDVQINSADFLDSIRPELPAPTPETRSLGKAAVQPEVTAEKRKSSRNDSRRKNAGKTEYVIPPIESEGDYLDLFIRGAETAARSGKMAYVRKEYHERIMRITRIIGKDKLTLSGYIDHVLTQHFLQCEDVIKKLYDKNYEDIF
ncbi:DUF3408 domain-containing protein [Bacteroides stercoris]|uniref:DUF3408 domain-containing protein n=1 Tax=Bacteroides stercoris TaxID=46506 RepID=UPI00101BB1F9|nr:DUF3408 domain-containing protein [Bacteroides stercoris]